MDKTDKPTLAFVKELMRIWK